MNVSVVIVTADRPDALERCVEAISTGNVQPNELVIVDQSSSPAADETRRLLSQLALRWVHLPVARMGVSAARNLGVERAEGDWLAFTDDDCVPGPAWLAELVSARTEARTDGATGAVLPLPDDRAGLVPVSSRASRERRVFGATDHRPAWEVGTGGNLLLSRVVFDEIGGFDTRFGPGAPYRAAEDIELLDRVLQNGSSIVYEPRAFVYHEMKTSRKRLAPRYPYGYGLGAMVSRRRSARRSLALAYGAIQVRSLARGLRQASGRQVAEPFLTVAGFSAGAVRGFLDARAQGRSRPPARS